MARELDPSFGRWPRFRARLAMVACGAALGAMLLLGAPFPPAPGIPRAHAAAAFVEGTEDVPLMPGLAMVEGAGTVFDSPQGRIVEAYARGTASRDVVLQFYALTLPQLGWKVLSPGVYRREGETLRLEIYPEKSETTVRFYLSPG